MSHSPKRPVSQTVLTESTKALPSHLSWVLLILPVENYCASIGHLSIHPSKTIDVMVASGYFCCWLSKGEYYEGEFGPPFRQGGLELQLFQ